MLPLASSDSPHLSSPASAPPKSPSSHLPTDAAAPDTSQKRPERQKKAKDLDIKPSNNAGHNVIQKRRYRKRADKKLDGNLNGQDERLSNIDADGHGLGLKDYSGTVTSDSQRHMRVPVGTPMWIKYGEEHYPEEVTPVDYMWIENDGTICCYITNFLLYNKKGERLLPIESLDHETDGEIFLYGKLVHVALVHPPDMIRSNGHPCASIYARLPPKSFDKTDSSKQQSPSSSVSEDGLQSRTLAINAPEASPQSAISPGGKPNAQENSAKSNSFFQEPRVPKSARTFPIRVHLVDWCIDYGLDASNVPYIWLISQRDVYYRLEKPAGRYVHLFAGTKLKFEICCRIIKTLQANPEHSFDEMVENLTVAERIKKKKGLKELGGKVEELMTNGQKLMESLSIEQETKEQTSAVSEIQLNGVVNTHRLDEAGVDSAPSTVYTDDKNMEASDTLEMYTTTSQDVNTQEPVLLYSPWGAPFGVDGCTLEKLIYLYPFVEMQVQIFLNGFHDCNLLDTPFMQELKNQHSIRHKDLEKYNSEEVERALLLGLRDETGLKKGRKLKNKKKEDNSQFMSSYEVTEQDGGGDSKYTDGWEGSTEEKAVHRLSKRDERAADQIQAWEDDYSEESEEYDCVSPTMCDEIYLDPNDKTYFPRALPLNTVYEYTQSTILETWDFIHTYKELLQLPVYTLKTIEFAVLVTHADSPNLPSFPRPPVYTVKAPIEESNETKTAGQSCSESSEHLVAAEGDEDRNSQSAVDTERAAAISERNAGPKRALTAFKIALSDVPYFVIDRLFVKFSSLMVMTFQAVEREKLLNKGELDSSEITAIYNQANATEISSEPVKSLVWLGVCVQDGTAEELRKRLNVCLPMLNRLNSRYHQNREASAEGGSDCELLDSDLIEVNEYVDTYLREGHEDVIEPLGLLKKIKWSLNLLDLVTWHVILKRLLFECSYTARYFKSEEKQGKEGKNGKVRTSEEAYSNVNGAFDGHKKQLKRMHRRPNEELGLMGTVKEEEEEQQITQKSMAEGEAIEKRNDEGGAPANCSAAHEIRGTVDEAAEDRGNVKEGRLAGQVYNEDELDGYSNNHKDSQGSESLNGEGATHNEDIEGRQHSLGTPGIKGEINSELCGSDVGEPHDQCVGTPNVTSNEEEHEKMEKAGTENKFEAKTDTIELDEKPERDSDMWRKNDVFYKEYILKEDSVEGLYYVPDVQKLLSKGIDESDTNEWVELAAHIRLSGYKLLSTTHRLLLLKILVSLIAEGPLGKSFIDAKMDAFCATRGNILKWKSINREAGNAVAGVTVGPSQSSASIYEDVMQAYEKRKMSEAPNGDDASNSGELVEAAASRKTGMEEREEGRSDAIDAGEQASTTAGAAVEVTGVASTANEGDEREGQLDKRYKKKTGGKGTGRVSNQILAELVNRFPVRTELVGEDRFLNSYYYYGDALGCHRVFLECLVDKERVNGPAWRKSNVMDHLNPILGKQDGNEERNSERLEGLEDKMIERTSDSRVIQHSNLRKQGLSNENQADVDAMLDNSVMRNRNSMDESIRAARAELSYFPDVSLSKRPYSLSVNHEGDGDDQFTGSSTNVGERPRKQIRYTTKKRERPFYDTSVVYAPRPHTDHGSSEQAKHADKRMPSNTVDSPSKRFKHSNMKKLIATTRGKYNKKRFALKTMKGAQHTKKHMSVYSNGTRVRLRLPRSQGYHQQNIGIVRPPILFESFSDYSKYLQWSSTHTAYGYIEGKERIEQFIECLSRHSVRESALAQKLTEINDNHLPNPSDSVNSLDYIPPSNVAQQCWNLSRNILETADSLMPMLWGAAWTEGKQHWYYEEIFKVVVPASGWMDTPECRRQCVTRLGFLILELEEWVNSSRMLICKQWSEGQRTEWCREVLWLMSLSACDDEGKIAGQDILNGTREHTMTETNGAIKENSIGANTKREHTEATKLSTKFHREEAAVSCKEKSGVPLEDMEDLVSILGIYFNIWKCFGLDGTKVKDLNTVVDRETFLSLIEPVYRTTLPQKDDRLVYFKDGHANMLEALKGQPVAIADTIPSYLNSMEELIVEDMWYHSGTFTEEQTSMKLPYQFIEDPVKLELFPQDAMEVEKCEMQEKQSSTGAASVKNEETSCASASATHTPDACANTEAVEGSRSSALPYCRFWCKVVASDDANGSTTSAKFSLDAKQADTATEICKTRASSRIRGITESSTSGSSKTVQTSSKTGGKHRNARDMSSPHNHRHVMLCLPLTNGMPEYFVKKEKFTAALNAGWKPGMRFKMLFQTGDQNGGARFSGTIRKVDIEAPNLWECALVEWDVNRKTNKKNLESVNIWELEPIKEAKTSTGRSTKSKPNTAAATECE